MKSRIFLVGCGKTKQPHPWYGPAEQLYIGSLTKKRIAYVKQERNREGDWFFISAEHGLVPPSKDLADYDRTVADMGWLERCIWASNVHDQLLHWVCRRQGKGTKLKSITVEIHAGVEYTSPLVSYLQASHFIVHQPVVGKDIHQLMHWYTVHTIKPGD